MKEVKGRTTTLLDETMKLDSFDWRFDEATKRNETLVDTFQSSSPATVSESEEQETMLLPNDNIHKRQSQNSISTNSGLAETLLFGFKSVSIENSPAVNKQNNSTTKYEYLSDIATGGMGRIVAVRDKALRRKVAMKLLVNPGSINSTKAANLLIAEAQTTGQLEHPNIIPIHDVAGVEGNNCFFTMKLVKGVTLREVFQKLQGDSHSNEHYSLPRMLAIFQQISNGLGFAHSRGVIHRDLKPQNIMIGEFGEVLIMDWGIAKLLKSPSTSETPPNTESTFNVGSIDTNPRAGTVLGTISGTVGYMSPEQARGEVDKLDSRTDIYSLGAMLYEMLTGSPPYNQSSIKERLAATASELPIDAPAMRFRKKHPKKRVKFPREVAAIAMKAISPRPDDRYQSAQEFFDDIQRFLEGRAVLASPDSLIQKTGRWMKRHRVIVRAAAAILLAVVVAVFAARFLIRRSMIASYTKETQRLVAAAKADRANQLQRISGSPTGTGDNYMDANRQRALDKVEENYSADLAQAANYYSRTFDYDPGNTNARSYLAEIYMEMWRAAQRRSNAELMSAYAQQVANYAGPDKYKSIYKTEIDGDGKLRISSGDAKAEILIYRYVEVGQWNRLIPVPYSLAERRTDDVALAQATSKLRQAIDGHDGSSLFTLDLSSYDNHLGQTPLIVDQMPIGSYLFLLRAPGYEDLRLPVTISRQKNLELSVKMLRTGERPQGFSYVPRVWAKVGGPAAGSKWPNFIWKWVDPFFIQTYEVTFGEYEEFLKGLIAEGRINEVRKHLPQDFGFFYLTLVGKKLVPNKVLTQGWRGWPLRGVSWLDAQSYAEWRSHKDGVTYRLPTELEWEVAARGTDGRRYTWGEVFWPQAARLTQGYSGPNNSQNNGLFSDESVFGVWDMTGSQAEWCMDKFEGREGEKALRGNAWGLQPVGLETAFRTSGRPDYFHASTGFRLALSLH